MVNVKILDSHISCILQKLCDGEKIFRINLDNMTIADLGDKSINVIKRDGYKYPNKYVYFMIDNEEVCIEGEVKKGTNNKPVEVCMASNLECTKCEPGPCMHRAMLFREV